MRVRVNSIYRFSPNGWDTFDAKHNGYLKDGDLVQVINLYGCPPANTMGQCYVRKLGDSSKAFAMVSTGSLSKHEYIGLGNTICGDCGHTLNHSIHIRKGR